MWFPCGFPNLFTVELLWSRIFSTKRQQNSGPVKSKNTMNKITRQALVLAALAFTAEAVHAQNVDLVLGLETFSSGSSSYVNNYMLNIGGAVSDVGAGGGANHTLAASMSLGDLSTLFSSGSFDTVLASVQGGINSGGSTARYLYTTVLRQGSGTDYSIAGTETAPAGSRGAVASAAGNPPTLISQNTGIQTHGGTVPLVGATAANSFTTLIVTPANTAGAPNGESLVGTSGIFFLDLFRDTFTSTIGTAVPFTYQGSIELNLNNGQISFLDGPTTAAPEPSTYGLMAAGGLLLVTLRNQFRRKQA
jgi:hypothetical protein